MDDEFIEKLRNKFNYYKIIFEFISKNNNCEYKYLQDILNCERDYTMFKLLYDTYKFDFVLFDLLETLNVDVHEWITKFEMNINVVNNKNESLLMVAIQQKNYTVSLNLILNGIDLKIKCDRGRRAINYAEIYLPDLISIMNAVSKK